MPQVAGVPRVSVAAGFHQRRPAHGIAALPARARRPDRARPAQEENRADQRRHQRTHIGKIEDAGATAEYDDLLHHEADLTAGHGVLRTTGLICVTAPSTDELDATVASIEQAAIQASCETPPAGRGSRRKRLQPLRCRYAGAGNSVQQQSSCSTSRSPVRAVTGILQASPRHASRPSLTAKTTITRAATESAHAQPKSVFSSSPTSRVAER